MRNIFVLIFYILLLFSCSPSFGPDESWKNTQINGEDYFWSNSAFLSSTELDELDILQKQLDDKTIFLKYIKLLTLTDKSDEEILNSRQASLDQKKRLMKHFIFLALTYGKGDYSFVDNPRLASLFEMDYFYFAKDFIKKNYAPHEYSDADKKLARYMLGGLIAMQASVKMQDGLHDKDKLIADITKGFSLLKYGRTFVFNKIILDLRADLREKISAFLQKDNLFIDNYDALKSQIHKQTYPGFSKKEYPNWPIDYSEVLASAVFKSKGNAVFGIGSGGTPIGTGFLAKHNNKILFLTSGHWKYNKKTSIMRQKDAKPFGSAPSELIWLNNKLDLFNFSEELVIPTLKALDFDDNQITKIKAKLGDNPFGKSFSIAQRFMPWLDMAIAIPSNAVLTESALDLNDVKALTALTPEKNQSHKAQTIAFGITEDLVSGDINRDKSPGLRRFNGGQILFDQVSLGNSPAIMRSLFYTPILLKQIEWWPELSSVFSMRFGPRCSGAPFFVGDEIVGLLQGPFEQNNLYAGLRMAEFTPQNLALINALIFDPRGLFHIPEKDLTQMIKTHIYYDVNQRKNLHENIKQKYLK